MGAAKQVHAYLQLSDGTRYVPPSAGEEVLSAVNDNYRIVLRKNPQRAIDTLSRAGVGEVRKIVSGCRYGLLVRLQVTARIRALIRSPDVAHGLAAIDSTTTHTRSFSRDHTVHQARSATSPMF